jgi:hypothetical protein
VAHGYDELVAAQAEIAASLDPAAAPYAAGIDVPANQVVVQTASADAAGVTAQARDAAARTAAEQPPRRAGAADMASAVRVEPGADIAIQPTDRYAFPPYYSGLYTRVWVGSSVLGCTTGWLWVTFYGAWGSTAGHCGRVNEVVAIGNSLVDVNRFNTYEYASTVTADTAVYSLSVGHYPAYPIVHVGDGLRIVRDRLSNAQLGPGLPLCFVGSDADVCGRVNRVNQTLSCDPAGHAYVFACLDSPSRPGDSGGPVYQYRYDGAVNAAATVSPT